MIFDCLNRLNLEIARENLETLLKILMGYAFKKKTLIENVKIRFFTLSDAL